MTMLDQAIEYLEWGWPVIPIIPETKKPAVKWAEFQDRLPTEEEITDWWSKWPDAHAALITGNLSGVVVVDCDSDEAIELCRDNGIWSPVRVRTPRGGLHLYFRHPQDGAWRGPRVGSNSRGIDWPKFPTLDFRGDGSYPVLPPSKDYTWEVDPGHDMDDMPMWRGWPMDKMEAGDVDGTLFSLNSLSLENNRVVGDHSMTEWEDTAALVAAKYPATGKLPTGGGNARNMRVTRYTAQMVVRGHWGEELRERVCHYMDTFFEDRLENWQGVVESIEDSERTNHPERFDDQGNYVAPVSEPTDEQVKTETQLEPEPDTPATKYIRMRDADDMLEASKNSRYLVEPWLQAGSIVQVAGFSGHGKSTFIGHILAAAATGRAGDDIGPFVLGKSHVKTLYLNYEESRGTIARRLKQFESAHGDTGDDYIIWAPFIQQDDMPLNQRDSLKKLGKMIFEIRPDVVVIDTIRSAWPGLKENEADAWAPFNLLVGRLRSLGMAVIALQHRNKGDAISGVGREAGSSHQLTMLDNQLFIDMVVESKDEAKTRACLCDQDYDNPVWPLLQDQLNDDEHLSLVLQVGYGKSREMDSPLAQPRQWIGIAEDLRRGSHRLIGSSSLRKRARGMWVQGGQTEIDIARRLGIPLDVVIEWVKPK